MGGPRLAARSLVVPSVVVAVIVIARSIVSIRFRLLAGRASAAIRSIDSIVVFIGSRIAFVACCRRVLARCRNVLAGDARRLGEVFGPGEAGLDTLLALENVVALLGSFVGEGFAHRLVRWTLDLCGRMLGARFQCIPATDGRSTSGSEPLGQGIAARRQAFADVDGFAIGNACVAGLDGSIALGSRLRVRLGQRSDGGVGPTELIVDGFGIVFVTREDRQHTQRRHD
jgi:hypothetical protein